MSRALLSVSRRSALYMSPPTSALLLRSLYHAASSNTSAAAQTLLGRTSSLPHTRAPTYLNIYTSSHMQARQIHTSDWLSLLMSKAPKGFGRFMPGSDDKNDKRDDADTEKSSNSKRDKDKDKEEDEEDDKDKSKETKRAGGGGRKNKTDDDDSGGSGFFGKRNWALYVMGAIAVYLFVLKPALSAAEHTSFQEFKKNMLAKGLVDRVYVVDGKSVRVELRSATGAPGGAYTFRVASVDAFERQMADAQRELGIHPDDFIPIQYVESPASGIGPLLGIGSTLVLVYLAYMMMKNMGGAAGGGGRNIFSIGKAKPTIITKESKVKTTFKDVAGLDEAKVEIMEFVRFLSNPEKFTALGAKLPKGALLVGPPGTGKTLLARATAGEAKVPFFSMSGSDFLEMFVGVGPSRVRDLFKQARESAPCIVFIDEIDAVGRARGRGGWGGGNDERENTLNQMLVEMDGFTSHTGVVVLAGTNRADVLDPALLRPGRFDRQIYIGNPDMKGRQEIFLVHLKGLKLKDRKEDIAQRMATLTPGMSGADIANLCNEAAMIAARHDKKEIELVDFEAAADRVTAGLERKSKVMPVKERNIVAHHESGHVVCGWFSEHADPVMKVTIIPRSSGALGFAQFLPQDLNLYDENQLTDRLVMALGGRAAEQVFFSSVTTGAADDLKKVTNIAYALVTRFGMNPRLGQISFPDPNEERMATKPYSEYTAQIIDEEASKIIQRAYDKAVALITEKKPLVEALATRLLKEETVNHDGLIEVLGPRPYTSETYSAYVREVSRWAKKDDKPTEEPKTDDEKKAADSADTKNKP